MSIIARGGRGKRAPYETVQVRCPRPIKGQVDELIASFRQKLEQGENAQVVGLSQSELVEQLQDLAQVNIELMKENERLKDRLAGKTATEEELQQLTIRELRELCSRFKGFRLATHAELVAGLKGKVLRSELYQQQDD